MQVPSSTLLRTLLRNPVPAGALALLMLLALNACQPVQAPRVVEAPAPEPVVEDTSAADIAAAEAAFEAQLRYQRQIADLNYEGIKALNASRLLTPPETSAHAYFSRVLAIEPDNAAALKGIQDIVAKYLQLAQQASTQGLYDNAKSYLRRAEEVDRNHRHCPGLGGAGSRDEVVGRDSQSRCARPGQPFRNPDGAARQHRLAGARIRGLLPDHGAQ